MSVSKYTHQLSFIQVFYRQQPQSYFIATFMIIVRKILSISIPFRPLLLYLNSTQPNGEPTTETVKPIQLSKEAQRALWANHFIKTIINQPFARNIESPSLHDKLITSPNPTTLHKFDQDIKKEMASIFTEGVHLNQRVFDQDRILKATFKDGRVVFYPSFQVTKPIFRQMHKSGTRIMFQGTFGIGKSISIAFYIYLSNIINKYTLQVAREGTQEQLNKYKQLVSNKFLPSHLRKFWYWSIDWDLVSSKHFSFQRILAEQASELTKDEREEIQRCGNIEEAHKKINELYKKADFTHVAVLDQINHAVSFIRKWNQFVYDNKALIQNANKGLIQPKDLARINDIYQPTTKLISLAKQFTAINQFHFILNSTVNIERQLLEAKETTDENCPQGQRLYKQLTLQLKYKDRNHQPLKICSLKFQQKLQNLSGKIGFWQFFVSLLEEKTKKYLTEQEFKQFKCAFLQYAITLDLKFYYRFLHIRMFLREFQFQIFKDFKKENTNKILEKIMYDFEKSVFQQFQQNLRKFIRQGNPKFNKSLLNAIYVLASYQKYKREKLVVDFQLLSQMMDRPDLKYTLRQYFISSEPYSQTIPVEEIQHQPYKVKISWTAQDFMLISNKILYGEIFKDNILLPGFQRYIMRTNNVQS